VKPVEVDDVTMAFPANVIGKYLPVNKDIPQEFWRGNKWTDIANQWFCEGLPKSVEFHAKSGINAESAFRHCKAIMGSFEPQHEHKIAGVGYLLSEFFEKIDLGDDKP
jgi:hypothetical protein